LGGFASIRHYRTGYQTHKKKYKEKENYLFSVQKISDFLFSCTPFGAVGIFIFL